MTAESKQSTVTGRIALILGVAIGLWLAWWYYIALAAAPQATPQDAASASRTGSQPTPVLAPGGDAMRAQLEAMDEQELKRFYIHCSQQGIERRLDGGEAIACSVGYDVLLKKHFAGDFGRLLAWSRPAQALAVR